jgi:hypothetical protein
VSEADDHVEVPDASAPAQEVIGGALGEGDHAHTVAPARQMGVAHEECVELRVCRPRKPFEIGMVKPLIRARRVGVLIGWQQSTHPNRLL